MESRKWHEKCGDYRVRAARRVYKNHKKGFTLIEVALFLAITGALFAGIIVGTQSTIMHQRFTDATQNFAEFLRSIYSQVSNPQSVGDGRSETLAIYGKLVVFGETTGLDGDSLEYNLRGMTLPGIDANGSQKIYVYDVVGDVNDNRSGDIKELLKELGANALVVTRDSEDIYHAAPAGIAEGYTVRWAATIEQARNDAGGVLHDLYTGSILVVRHPRSGTINTLISPETIEVNSVIARINENPATTLPAGVYSLLTDKISSFDPAQVDFCINSSGILSQSELRRDVRLAENARNASGVQIIDLDSDDNLCR